MIIKVVVSPLIMFAYLNEAKMKMFDIMYEIVEKRNKNSFAKEIVNIILNLRIIVEKYTIVLEGTLQYFMYYYPYFVI